MGKHALRQNEFPEISGAEDASYEVWRLIFRAIVAQEVEALQTGQTVTATLVVEVARKAQASALAFEIICEPNTPARIKTLTNEPERDAEGERTRWLKGVPLAPI